jgi:Ribbon-helix-helix protein, copG family
VESLLHRRSVKRFTMTENGYIVSSDPHVTDRDMEQRLSITLPRDLDRKLRAFADESERSMAAVVRLALRQLLDTRMEREVG